MDQLMGGAKTITREVSCQSELLLGGSSSRHWHWGYVSMLLL